MHSSKLTTRLLPVAVVVGALCAPALASAAEATPTATTPPASPGASPTAVPLADSPAPSPTTPPTGASPAPSPEPTPGPSAMEDDPGLVPQRPTKKLSFAARLVVPVVVRRTPSNRGRRVTALRPYGSWNGGPVVLQIADVKTLNDTTWLRVRLGIRPNGVTGWIRQSSVEVRALRYRITISRRNHKLTLFKDGEATKSTKVVIGASSTPTPKGTFAVLEVVRQPKGEVIGPWALHLTAHSNVLDNYGGGPGRVAIHGRSGALLNDPLGSSRSHGCIRIPNSFVTMLSSVATEGTPVVIS